VAVGPTHFFAKPRTVFWEWLLFGSTSPLYSLLSRPLEISGQGSPAKISIADTVFGLELESSPESPTGTVREVSASGGRPGELEDEAYLRFGVLLAYCYALGVQDLHRDNVVPVGNRLQVIDAEVVFTKLLLPHETLLLPFKDATLSQSALSHIIGGDGHIELDKVLLILGGFTSAINGLDSCSERLIQLLSSELHKSMSTPIRVILRDTRKYRDRGPFPVDSPLFLEEMVQLERDDIPYFFTRINDPRLYYLRDEMGTFEGVELPARFHNDLRRAANGPEQLLSRKRIREELLAPGIFLILRKLLRPDVTLSWNFREFSLDAYSEKFALKSPWGNFTAVRTRVLEREKSVGNPLKRT